MTDLTARERLILEDLFWLLECEMATLERCKGVKSTPKSETNRHEGIVLKSLTKIRKYGLALGDVPKNHPRIRKALERLS